MSEVKPVATTTSKLAVPKVAPALTPAKEVVKAEPIKVEEKPKTDLQSKIAITKKPAIAGSTTAVNVD